MKRKGGTGLHLWLWAIYFGVNLFNELYLSPSFTLHPALDLFLSAVAAQVLLFALKVPAVYYVLYLVIPRWLQPQSKKTRLIAECLLATAVMLVCYRLLVNNIVFPLIYKEPHEILSPLQEAARTVYSLLDLLQAIGIAAAIYLFSLRIAAMRNEKALLREKLQSEMQFLRSQINPHFLFNTLNSIYALARAKSADTPDVVMRLSKIMRYVLYEANKKAIAISEELRITRDYIALQQVRYGDKVRVALDTKVDDKEAPITPLILLPLIENAFKHGTSDVAKEIDIACCVQLAHERLSVNVRNPAGSLSVKSGNDEGIGLKNMDRRLQLLYRDYTLRYGESDGIFSVELNINLKSYAGFELPDSGR